MVGENDENRRKFTRKPTNVSLLLHVDIQKAGVKGLEAMALDDSGKGMRIHYTGAPLQPGQPLNVLIPERGGQLTLARVVWSRTWGRSLGPNSVTEAGIRFSPGAGPRYPA